MIENTSRLQGPPLNIVDFWKRCSLWGFRRSFDWCWISTARYLYYICFQGFINLEFRFFANGLHLYFSTVLVCSIFHQLQNLFGVLNNHNLSLLSFYEIMPLADFEILLSKKEILRGLTFSVKPFKFHEYFLWRIFFKKYLKFARRQNKKVWCLII